MTENLTFSMLHSDIKQFQALSNVNVSNHFIGWHKMNLCVEANSWLMCNSCHVTRRTRVSNIILKLQGIWQWWLCVWMCLEIQIGWNSTSTAQLTKQFTTQTKTSSQHTWSFQVQYPNQSPSKGIPHNMHTTHQVMPDRIPKPITKYLKTSSQHTWPYQV